jgi:hypothetical protein
MLAEPKVSEEDIYNLEDSNNEELVETSNRAGKGVTKVNTKAQAKKATETAKKSTKSAPAVSKQLLRCYEVGGAWPSLPMRNFTFLRRQIQKTPLDSFH